MRRGGWTEFPVLMDRFALYKMLRVEEMTVPEIAERVGCTQDQVRSALRNHGFAVRVRE